MQLSKANKAIVTWLYIGVAMIIIQVLLGGITRLTGSGLSITEWKPIMGALPPLNETDWQIAFDKYKTIGQYKYLNAHFTMGDFKFIFFWEWLHRNWARLIGIVFLVPFIWFIAKGYIQKKYINQFVIIFIVGLLQAAVGMIMVASGLNENDLYVNYFKLATHFITALVALVAVYWYALYFSTHAIVINKDVKPGIKKWTVAIIILLAIQLAYGAFMAGLKAAAAAPTWPLIGNAWVPSGLWQNSFYAHPINIHFVHRNLAYIITLLIFIYTYKMYKVVQPGAWAKSKMWPLIFVILQVALGISTVLTASKPAQNAMGSFEWSAQLHQLVALFLLLSLVRILFLVRNNPATAASHNINSIHNL
jgi:heme a synthase